MKSKRLKKISQNFILIGSLSLLLSGTQLTAAAEKKQPTQTRYQQAVKSLQEYSGKAQASVSKFVRCLRGLEDCSKEDISRARKYSGIVAAALAVIAIGGTGFILMRKKSPSPAPLFSDNLTEETEKKFRDTIETKTLTSHDITKLGQQLREAYKDKSPTPVWISELMGEILTLDQEDKIAYEGDQAKKAMYEIFINEYTRMKTETLDDEIKDEIQDFIDQYQEKKDSLK